MERWIGKVAVVTGSSSGIGESIARRLSRSGMIVIGLARRIDRLHSLKEQLGEETGEFHYHECDISDLASVKIAFAWILKSFNVVHVLINNAGLNNVTSILAENNEHILQEVVNTNLMGSLYCTKEAYQIMKNSPGEYHIININSILGHYIIRTSRDVKLNLYPSSKFGLRAAAEVLRLELLEDKRFHVSSISPGLVRTEIGKNHPDANRFLETQPTLEPDDIAQTVFFILGIGTHVQISDVIIKPVGERI